MDEEQKFKAMARPQPPCSAYGPPKKLGAIRPIAATAYAKEVVAADFEQPGENDVVHKVTRDLAGKGCRHHRSAASRQDGRAAGAGDLAGGRRGT